MFESTREAPLQEHGYAVDEPARFKKQFSSESSRVAGRMKLQGFVVLALVAMLVAIPAFALLNGSLAPVTPSNDTIALSGQNLTITATFNGTGNATLLYNNTDNATNNGILYTNSNASPFTYEWDKSNGSFFDGRYTLTLTVINSTNASDNQTIYFGNITVDNTGPTATQPRIVPNATNNGVLYTNATPQATSTLSDALSGLRNCSYAWTNGAWSEENVSGYTGGASCSSSLGGSSFPDGYLLNVTFRALDNALNNGQNSTRRTAVVDDSEPVVTFTMPGPNIYADGDTILVQASVSDSGSNITNSTNCNPAINGLTGNFTGTVTYSNATGMCAGTLTLNTPSGLSDAQHLLSLRVADAVNNAGSANLFIQVDNTPPLVPAIAFSTRNPANTSVSITLTVTVNDTANVSTVQLTNGTFARALTRNSGTATNGSYNITFTPSEFNCRNETLCAINITANDTLGNTNSTVSMASATQLNNMLFIDTFAPTVVSNSTNVSSASIGESVSFNATWADVSLLSNMPLGASLEIYNTTAAVFTQAPNGSWPGYQGTYYANRTNFTYVIPAVSEGRTVTGRLRLNDTNGNSNVTANLTIDIANATPSIGGVTNHSYVVQNGSIAFNLSDLGAGINISTFTIIVDGADDYTISYASNASLFNCTSGVYTNYTQSRNCSVQSRWPQGNFTLTAQVADIPGNNVSMAYALYGITVWPQLVNISVDGARVTNETPSSIETALTSASRSVSFGWDVLSDLTTNSTSIALLNTSEQATFSSLPATASHNVTAGRNYIRINLTMNPVSFTDEVLINLTANVPLNLTAFRALQVGRGVITDFNVSDGSELTTSTGYINKTVDITVTMRNASHAVPFHAVLAYHDVDGLAMRWNASSAFNISLSSDPAGANDTIILTSDGTADMFLDSRHLLTSMFLNLTSANRTFYYYDASASARKLLLPCAAPPAAPLPFSESCYVANASNVTLFLSGFGTGDSITVTEPPSPGITLSISTPNATNNSLINVNFTADTPFPRNASFCAFNVTVYNTSNASLPFTDDTLDLADFTAPADKWAYQVPVPAGDGRYKLSVNCTDLYGNTAASSLNITINDTITPAISNTAASEVTRREALITGAASEQVLFIVKYGTAPTGLNQTVTQADRASEAEIQLRDLDEGTRYYYNLTGCDLKGLCATSSTNTFKTLDPSTSSGGGGGGAGVDNIPKQTDFQGSDAHVIGSVRAGETVTYTTDLAFSKISLRFTEDVTGARITIKQYNTTPKGVLAAPGVVYKYLSIEHQGLKTDEHRLEVAIDKRWVQSAVDPESIRVYRLEGTDWRAYTPVHVRNEDDLMVYAVSVPGFSHFAIGGTSTAKPVEEVEEDTEGALDAEEGADPKTDSPAEFIPTGAPREKGMRIPPWLIIIVLAVVVSVGAVVGLKQYQVYRVKEGERMAKIRAEGAHIRAMDAQLKAHERPAEHDPMWQLHHYIATQRAKGTPDDLIKQRLVSVGWDEFVVSMEMMRR